MKGNDYYNTQKKFQIHSSNIFGLRAKTNIPIWQPPPNIDSLLYPCIFILFYLLILLIYLFTYFFFLAKVTGTDDPIISCSH